MEMRQFSFKRWNARTFVFTCDGASTGVGGWFPGEAGWAGWVGGDLWLAGGAGRVVGRPCLDVFATKRLRNTDHILWKKFILRNVLYQGWIAWLLCVANPKPCQHRTPILVENTCIPLSPNYTDTESDQPIGLHIGRLTPKTKLAKIVLSITCTIHSDEKVAFEVLKFYW